MSGDVQLVHELGPSRGALDIVYAEDNLAWVIVRALLAFAAFAVVAVLYLAGPVARRPGRAVGRGEGGLMPLWSCLRCGGSGAVPVDLREVDKLLKGLLAIEHE